jgi:hypothetical protein
MKSLNVAPNIQIEFKDLELLSKINQITLELSIPLDVFITTALDKLLSDIQFVRELRNSTLVD